MGSFTITETKDHFYLFSSLTVIGYKTNLLTMYKHMEIYIVYLPQSENRMS